MPDDEWAEALAEANKIAELEEDEARRQKAREDAYAEKWPKYCRACGGWGSVTFEQSHPYGSTYAIETLSDICFRCLENGKCPRCEGPMEEDEPDRSCPSCGWDPKKPDGV